MAIIVSRAPPADQARPGPDFKSGNIRYVARELKGAPLFSG
jgi:hypothetical protein